MRNNNEDLTLSVKMTKTNLDLLFLLHIHPSTLATNKCLIVGEKHQQWLKLTNSVEIVSSTPSTDID